MKFERSAGVLLHPTSLPGAFGIGDLGPQAYRFVEFLSAAGCKLWQVLPLGPTGYADSPYQSLSAFAGNHYLISPQKLLEDGLLASVDLADKPEFPAQCVEYGAVIPWKLKILERAFANFQRNENPLLQDEFLSFQASSVDWLEDYALFMAVKQAHDGRSWVDWPVSLRQRKPARLVEASQTLQEARRSHAFYQFIFFRQWRALRDYARQQGVRIIGDIPIFLALDSVDVWAHPELFCLDAGLNPTVVAGVPPDYFSPTGQLWGNPLYHWPAHRKQGYSWWLARIRTVLSLVDFVRLDHFRGFAGYWEIPAGRQTAEVGRWVRGPGKHFFRSIQKELTDLPFLAEDLGLITPDVVELRETFGLPGMKVLQFAFTSPDNPFLPHRYQENCVAYTGTHDNDTTWGWYRSASETERDFACRYLEVDGSDFAWDLIRAAWGSVAVFTLAPMQDLLNLGSQARMNYPGHEWGNWAWRMEEDALNKGLLDRLREINIQCQRCQP